MEIKDKKLTLLRLQTIFIAAILVIVLLVGIFAAVEFTALHRSLAVMEREVQALEMDGVNEAVGALTAAAENLAEIDVDGLNGTAASLREAADNLSQVDITALNRLVASLTTTAEKLENAVNAISNFFGR